LGKDIPKLLAARPSEKVVVDEQPDCRTELRAAPRTGRLEDVFDSLKRENGPSTSIEEMNEITAQGWADER
jgi:hypothetical protein